MMTMFWATTVTENKKADVAEHPEAFHHVGLLVNGFSAVAGYPLSSLPSDYRHLKIVLPVVTERAARTADKARTETARPLSHRELKKGNEPFQLNTRLNGTTYTEKGLVCRPVGVPCCADKDSE
jgi:hypothetical protein